jgi:WD40 repeat protein
MEINFDGNRDEDCQPFWNAFDGVKLRKHKGIISLFEGLGRKIYSFLRPSWKGSHLLQHTHTVHSLTTIETPTGTQIVSGSGDRSYDNTVRIWEKEGDNWVTKFVLGQGILNI